MKIAAVWRGIKGSSVGDTQSDYDRACSVSDYLGKVTCGVGEVLILGDEPLRSAFFQTDDHILTIARWWACESEEEAETVLSHLPSQLPVLEAAKRFVVDTPLIMFDSANDTIASAEYRMATILPGQYTVTAEFYEVAEVFRFWLHRFVRD